MRMKAMAAILCAGAACADMPAELATANVVFLGEVHDNTAHHARQAELVSALQPGALVFEMLTPAQASKVTSKLMMQPQALADTLDWADSGWPNFAMYAPIFAAAPKASVFGGHVPRDETRKAAFEGIEAVFPQAKRFGLLDPLPQAQQEAREALQLTAHCDALPGEMLPVMVEIQRLRDAALALAVQEAQAATDGVVVIITGNGHARKDWGAPRLLSDIGLVHKDEITSLGQSEFGSSLNGTFDVTEMTTGVDREDPCKAFVESSEGD